MLKRGFALATMLHDVAYSKSWRVSIGFANNKPDRHGETPLLEVGITKCTELASKNNFIAFVLVEPGCPMSSRWVINRGNEKYASFEDIEHEEISTLMCVGRETSESYVCKISIIVGLIRNEIHMVEKKIESGNISIGNNLRLKNYIFKQRKIKI